MENYIHQNSIEALPPRNKIQRLTGMVDRFAPQNPPPQGRPLKIKAQVGSQFGLRKHPIDKKWKLHRGIDIPTRGPVNCYPTTPGKIIEIGHLVGGAGNYVVVNHGNGFVTRYLHLSNIVIKLGQKVTTSTILGKTGSTGSSTGTHLHYEVLYLDYPASVIAYSTLHKDKWIDPTITLNLGWQNAESKLPTLAGYDRNFVTNTTIKTPAQVTNFFEVINQAEEDDNYILSGDPDIQEIEDASSNNKITERIITHTVPVILAEKVLSLRRTSKPSLGTLISVIHEFNTSIEIDLGGYSTSDVRWILQERSKLADIVISTISKSGSEYEAYAKRIFNLFGINELPKSYPLDYEIWNRIYLLIARNISKSTNTNYSQSYYQSSPPKASIESGTALDSAQIDQLNVTGLWLNTYVSSDNLPVNEYATLAAHYAQRSNFDFKLIHDKSHLKTILKLNEFVFQLCNQFCIAHNPPHDRNGLIHHQLYQNKFRELATLIANTHGYSYTGVFTNDTFRVKIIPPLKIKIDALKKTISQK